MYLVFSILGLIGRLLCCTGDILFDLKGKGNEKLGTSKNIDSSWIKMADWRFGLSIALAMIGDALVGLGFYSIGMQIAEKYSLLGYLTIGFGYFGAMAGIFIHSFLCIHALIYKGAMIHGNLQIADDILEKIYKQIMPTFLIGYAALLVRFIHVRTDRDTEPDIRITEEDHTMGLVKKFLVKQENPKAHSGNPIIIRQSRGSL